MRTTTNMFPQLVSIFLTVLLTIGLTAGASFAQQDSTLSDTTDARANVTPEHAPVVIGIARQSIPLGTQTDTLPIALYSEAEVAGFQLKIGVNTPGVEIIDILPGRVIDSCKWELFRPMKSRVNSATSQPASLWQVTALSRTTLNPESSLACASFTGNSVIANVVVNWTQVDLAGDTVAPIFFFWEDCRDNALATTAGNQMLISKQVFDYYPVTLETSPDRFPTRFGTPKECINPGKRNAPQRLVEFHNGGLSLTIPAPPDEDDDVE